MLTVGCALTLERRMCISHLLCGKYILKTELKCKRSNLLHPLANLSKKDLKQDLWHICVLGKLHGTLSHRLTIWGSIQMTKGEA